MKLGKDEFLIVTKKAGQALAKIIEREDLPEKQQRHIFLALLSDGEVITTIPDKRGEIRVVRSMLQRNGVEVEMLIQYAVDNKGNPRRPNWGKRDCRLVFLDSCKIVPPAEGVEE